MRNICPAEPGAKDWQPSAYSPQTGLLYIPHQNLCEDIEGTEVSYIEGTPYVGANVKMYAGPGGNRGDVQARGIRSAAKEVWSIKENFPVWSGTVVTAGDVVFYGTMDGWFKAVNAQDRRAALAVQGRLRDHRPADDLQGTRRQAVRRRALGRRRLGRRDRRRRSRPAATRRRRSGSSTRWPICRARTTKGGTLYVFVAAMKHRVALRHRSC